MIARSHIRVVLALFPALLVAGLPPAHGRSSERERLVEVLALREGMSVADVGAGDGEWAERLAGEVGPAGHVYATKIDDDDVEVPTGEVGEFCLRPERPYTIFNGYFRNPEATLASFRNLWYHTGDLGRRSDKG